MICPACGHENSDLATVCSSCGAKLQPDWDGTWSDGPHGQQNGPSEDTGDTLPQDPAQDAPDAPPEDEPRLSDLIAGARRLASSKVRRASQLVHGHSLAVALGSLGVLAATAAIVVLVMLLANTPSDAFLETDLADRMPSFDYLGGPYGADETIDASSVTITRKLGCGLPSGATSDVSVGPSAYQVEAELDYSSSSVEVVRNVACVYVHQDGQWEPWGEPEDQGISYQALSGVDQAGVLDAMPTILQSVDQDGTAGDVSSAYQGAQFSVTSESFEQAPQGDTSKDTLTIHGTQSFAFHTLECDLTVNFAFANGKWQLRSATTDDDALTPRYDVLESDWTGSFVGTQSTKARCYGASTTSLEVTIADVGDSSGDRSMVTGTISGLVHYHEPSASDEDSDPDDKVLDGVAFTGTISTEHEDATGSELNIECSIPDATGGSVAFTLGFGTKDEPEAVVAVVRTTHEYTETYLLIFPADASVTYTDTYRLSRSTTDE